MFDDWRRAWREAVENFRRELDAGSAGGDAAATRLYREVYGARATLRQLEAELGRVRRAQQAEHTEAETCRRREEMARRIADAETQALAAQYAERHDERAAVLARKVEVMEAELTLHRRELAEMETAARARGGPMPPPTPDMPRPGDASRVADREDEDAEFRRLDRAARERAAEERLEELKKRMR